MSFIGKKRKLITLLVVAAITACFLTTAAYADTSETNTTKNIIIGGDFESGLDYWSEYSWYEDVSQFKVDKEVFRSGSASFLISSKSENDARIIQEIQVAPSAYYTVTAYIKTENVPASDADNYRVGATISIINTTFRSSSVCGDTDWTKVEFSFYTAKDMNSVQLCFTLGGYGSLNSGKAWFDDISVKRVYSKPSQCFELESTKTDTSSGSGHWAGYPLSEEPDSIKWIAFAFAWFIVLAALAIAFAETGDISGNGKKTRRTFIFALVGAFLFRCVVAMFTPSFGPDIGLFKYWGWYASTDLFNMYSGELSFLDYPPLYMYALAPIGAIANALQDVMGGAITTLILKMPSILADIITSILLYKFAKRYLDSKWAMVIGLIYAANPATWINSAAWGQVDSFFTMLIVIEVMCLTNKKWAGAGIFFALMVLMKPHGIIFTPAIGLILLIELIRNKNWKPIVISVSCGILTLAALLLPFYIRTNFENPTWIVELYAGTIGQYNYATMNGFNFWVMLGFNITSAETVWHGLTFAQWGMIGIVFSIVLAIVFAVFGSRKNSKVKDALPSILSLVLIVSVFTFAHKMHERYMFAAMALALMAFIQCKDRWYLYLSMIFAAVVFANTYMIYNLYIMWTYCYPASGDIAVTIISTIEVISFVLLVITTVKVLIMNKISSPKSVLELNTNKTKGEADYDDAKNS